MKMLGRAVEYKWNVQFCVRSSGLGFSLKARKLVGKIEVAGNVLAKSYMGEKKKSYMDLRPLLQVITDA